jgi:hypothetical protein
MPTTTIRLPRGSRYEGLRCPRLRGLTPQELSARQAGRSLLSMASPEAQAWVELNLKAEIWLWDHFGVELP